MHEGLKSTGTAIPIERLRSHVLAILLVCLAAPTAVFALGTTDESAYVPVEGLENWTYEIDTGELTEGPYNILIRATDTAGNQSFSEPSNIRIDSESDIPSTGISVPLEEEIVGPRLVVLGTARDDDEISQVWVSLDENDAIRATGAEYWSLELDLEDYEEGPHVIHAWSVDENANESEPVEVEFILDTGGPEIILESPELGATVGGKVRVAGVTRDTNGLSEVRFRVEPAAIPDTAEEDTPETEDVDAVDPFSTLEPETQSVRRNRQEKGFSFDVKTGDLPDGPIIVWVESEDVHGNVSAISRLLYVDNDPPALTLDEIPSETLYPGNAVLTGSVEDPSGIDVFTWEIRGGESGDIPLIPGSSYWMLPIVDAGRSDSLQVELTVGDPAGNETTQRIDLEIDREADKPVVTRIEGNTTDRIVGWAVDDDGIAAVEYSIGRSGEWQTIETTGTFRIDPEDLSPGPHEFSLRGVDVHGNIGDETEGLFVVSPTRPTLEQPLLQRAESSEELVHGVALAPEEGASVSGRVSLGDTPGPGYAIRYKIDDRPAETMRPRATDDPGMLEYTVPLDRREPEGRYELTIELLDSDEEPVVLDRVSTYYRRGAASDNGDAAILDGRLAAPIGRDGRLPVLGGRPVMGIVPGAEITAAGLVPDSPEFTLRWEGSVFRIIPERAGRYEGGAVTGETAAGGRFEVSVPPLEYDTTAPTITVQNPVQHGAFSEPPRLVVQVADDVVVEAVEASFDGADFVPLRREEGLWVIESPPSAEDGPVVVDLRARDAVGNTAREVLLYMVDRTPPVVSQLLPPPSVPVNGRIRAVFTVEDTVGIAAVRWFGDGVTPTPVAPERVIEIELDLNVLPEDGTIPFLSVEDRAGNVTDHVMEVLVDPASDMPVVALQLPPPDSVQTEDFVVSGTVFDDDGPAEVFYRIDEGEPESIGTDSGFSFPLSPAELGDNEHQVSVFARDSGGAESEAVAVNVRVNLEPPDGSVESPLLEDVQSGSIRIDGAAEDANGIASVAVSIDNGMTFLDAQPAGEDGEWNRWSYEFDGAVLPDGLHAIQYRIEDSYGARSILSHIMRVDNTAPVIAIDTPGEIDVIGGTVPLTGRVTEAGELRVVEYRLLPMGEEYVPIEILPGGIFRGEIPVDGTRPGVWNLSVRATDAAGNRTEDSLNLRIVNGEADSPSLTVFSPIEGDRMVSPLMVGGRVPSGGDYERVLVSVSDGPRIELVPDGAYRFAHRFGVGEIPPGVHTVRILAESSSDNPTIEQHRTVTVEEYGPWIEIESHSVGALVGRTPTLAGSAGYRIPPNDEPDPESREGRQSREQFEIETVEVSLDNGRTFTDARGRESWEFRIETLYVSDGPLPILVRTRAKNGDTATVRTLLEVDTRPPVIALDQPRDGSRFNDDIFVSGTAGDANGLERVELVLRTGDAGRYSVPEFIQGLYVDAHVLGASMWDVGMGLTFFNDNVKLQAQIGYAPEGRFSGTVFGGKLLANVVRIPASYVLGPQWGFLSASLAIGANFSYFTMSESTRAEQGLVLGGVVAQLEFPAIATRTRVFRSFSLYTEPQFWFVSSDVEGGTEFKLSFGLRTQLL